MANIGGGSFIHTHITKMQKPLEATLPIKLDVDDVYVVTIAREAWLQSGR